MRAACFLRVNCGSKPKCFVNAARKNGCLKLELVVHDPGCSRDNRGLFAVRGMCICSPFTSRQLHYSNGYAL